MFPKLNSCCGYSLYTSSLVLAWIQVLLCGLLGFAVPQMKPSLRPFIYMTVYDYHYELKCIIPCPLMFYILAVLLLINCLLLCGIYKKNRWMMMPYLITAGVFVVLHMPYVISMMFLARVPEFFLHATIEGPFCYIWLIFFSYYQAIKPHVPVLSPQAPALSPQAPQLPPQAPEFTLQAPMLPPQAPQSSHQAPMWPPQSSHQAPILPPQLPEYSLKAPELSFQPSKVSKLYNLKLNNLREDND